MTMHLIEDKRVMVGWEEGFSEKKVFSGEKPLQIGKKSFIIDGFCGKL